MGYCISFSRQRFHQIVAIFASVLIVLRLITPAKAEDCHENAMLVFDASGSMGAKHDGMSKIAAAQEAAAEVLPDVTRHRPTGLITYGGMHGSACGNVHLKIPPMLESGDLIRAELGLMEPRGQTPLSDAVMLAAKTLEGLAKPGVIVLVTDGVENCGYDACLIGRKLKSEIPNIRVHVIGFHLQIRHEGRLVCLAQATGGTYATADSLETLRDALRKKLSCVQISKVHDRDVTTVRRKIASACFHADLNLVQDVSLSQSNDTVLL